MSEAADAVAAPAASPSEPTKKELVNPLMAWVVGGTTTSKHDEEVARQFAASEHARDVRDEEKRLASIPIEQGGAMMHTRDLRGPAGATYVVVDYVNRYGQLFTTGLVDVGMDADGSMFLMLVCPKCIQRGLHHDQAQLKMSQRNKEFEFVPHTRAVFKEFDGTMYRVAGRIRASEKFRCGRCEWVARFDEDQIVED